MRLPETQRKSISDFSTGFARFSPRPTLLRLLKAPSKHRDCAKAAAVSGFHPIQVGLGYWQKVLPPAKPQVSQSLRREWPELPLHLVPYVRVVSSPNFCILHLLALPSMIPSRTSHQDRQVLFARFDWQCESAYMRSSRLERLYSSVHWSGATGSRTFRYDIVRNVSWRFGFWVALGCCL